MSYEIIITDKESEIYGKNCTGSLCYHDVHHTGEGPDLFSVECEEKKYQVLSTIIDVEHYNQQLIKEVVEELGANIGDMVMVAHAGGGSFSAEWSYDVPHKITKISPSENIQFDGGCGKPGGGSKFRPKVTLINSNCIDAGPLAHENDGKTHKKTDEKPKCFYTIECLNSYCEWQPECLAAF